MPLQYVLRVRQMPSRALNRTEYVNAASAYAAIPSDKDARVDVYEDGILIGYTYQYVSGYPYDSIGSE